MGALDGERGTFGSDGSGTRSVLGAMLAEAVRTCSMRLGPFCGDRHDRRAKRRIP